MAFCKAGTFECFFGGAKSPGKTDCLIMEAARFYHVPKYHAVILRRTFPRLQEIIDRCWTWYPKIGGSYRATEHRWYFEGGAKISLGHCQNEADKHNYHGKEYQYIGFDELTEFTESQYLFIMAQARKAFQGVPLRIRATSNPGGIGHSWVKRRFVDITTPGEVYIDPATGQSRLFIPATVYDNPTIMENDPMYVRRLEALPPIERRRFLLGDWAVAEGQVFSELSQQTHGAEPFPIPAEWEKFMVFDWGYSRPWCALWFAVDFDGVMYLYREKYGMVDGDPNRGARQTNTEICREIHKCEQEKMNFRVADPACWGPTKIKGSNQVLGPSFVEDASKEGLFFLKADNDRIRGVQQMHQRLKIEEITDRDGIVIDERVNFIAFNDLGRFWEEMQDLYEDPNDPELYDTDQPDEGADCFRYATMSRPIIPKRRINEPQGTFATERKRLINAKSYAQRHGVSLAAAYARVR